MDIHGLNDRLRIWTCINVRETGISCAKGEILPISVLFMIHYKLSGFKQRKKYLFILLKHEVMSWSDIRPYTKLDKPLVANIFGHAM